MPSVDAVRPLPDTVVLKRMTTALFKRYQQVYEWHYSTWPTAAAFEAKNGVGYEDSNMKMIYHCVCLSLPLFISVCVCLSLSRSLSLSVCVFLSFALSVSCSFCLSLFLSLALSVCLSISICLVQNQKYLLCKRMLTHAILMTVCLLEVLSVE